MSTGMSLQFYLLLIQGYFIFLLLLHTLLFVSVAVKGTVNRSGFYSDMVENCCDVRTHKYTHRLHIKLHTNKRGITKQTVVVIVEM